MNLKLEVKQLCYTNLRRNTLDKIYGNKSVDQIQ